MTVFDAIGLLGVAAYIGGYAMLQLEWPKSDDTAYLLLNGAGSALILVSLFESFNLPFFVTQELWLIFTIVGFSRKRRSGWRARAGSE